MSAYVSQEAKDAAERVMAGTPIMQVARETGVAHSTILRRLRALGVVAPVRARRGPKAKAAKEAKIPA